MAHCYKCNQSQVADEFQRCESCEAIHQELCAKLDSRPKAPKIEKVNEPTKVYKQVKDGILVTTYETIEKYHG